MDKNDFNSPELQQRIALFENRTGYELVITAAPSSDPYPGASSRGGILLGLFLSALLLHFFHLESSSLTVVLVGALILVSYYLLKLTRWHRYFILLDEAERESAEKAGMLFSQFQSQSLGHQAALLLYISQLEHKMHLLVDKSLQEKLTPDDLHETLACLRMHFRQKMVTAGLIKSIDILEKIILAKVGKNPSPPQMQIANRVFWLE